MARRHTKKDHPVIVGTSQGILVSQRQRVSQAFHERGYSQRVAQSDGRRRRQAPHEEDPVDDPYGILAVAGHNINLCGVLRDRSTYYGNVC